MGGYWRLVQSAALPEEAARKTHKDTDNFLVTVLNEVQ
jgi:hypothetical protein